MITKKMLVPQSQSSSPIMQYTTILEVLFGRLHFTFFPGGSDSKASVCNAGDLGSIPGVGMIPWRRKW